MRFGHSKAKDDAPPTASGMSREPSDSTTRPVLSGQAGLDDALLRFTDKDTFTVRDAFEGVQIFGGTGSGKTSGSGRALARAFLGAGFGGLVLTAKADELALWQDLCRDAKRENDLRVIEPGGRGRINFLEYEVRNETATTYDLVSLLLVAMQGGKQRQSRDPYWDDTLRQLLVNAIDLLSIGERRVDLPGIVGVVRGAPRSADEARWIVSGKGPQGSPIPDRLKMMETLLVRGVGHAKRDPAVRADMSETIDYWTKEFPGLDPRTRSSIASTFMSKASGLLRSPFRDLFSTDTTRGPDDVTPDATFSGAIIIVNLPLKTYGEAGRLAQVLYKTVWQRAVERRGAAASPLSPVFLWADEAQYFATEQDMLFQQTARSARCATVYLTQSLPNYYAMLGDSDASSSATDSLLGNLQTKIFHANSDPVTNEWAERVFGYTAGSSMGTGLGSGGATMNRQDTIVPVIPSIEFTKLRKGGPANGFLVEGFVFRGGRRWEGGKRHQFKHGSEWSPGESGQNALLTSFEQSSIDLQDDCTTALRGAE